MSQTLEGHTLRRFDGELNALHLRVMEMGGLVLDQVRQALQALLKKDLMAARLVLEREQKVDDIERQADEEVVNVIARRSPVARDLRVIMAFSKAITDLERVGDEAARIAYLATEMYNADRSDPSPQLLRDINTIGNLAVTMLADALDALDVLDQPFAEALLQGHSEMDAEFQSSLRRLATFILEDARNVGHTIHVTLAIKSLERVGDHARNLAEYIIYLTRGEDVRHRSDETKHPKQSGTGGEHKD